MKMSILSLQDIAQHPILAPMTASFEQGRVVGIIGPNGSGKSTLLRSIVGVLPPTAGDVFVQGEAVRKLSPKQRARHMAYLPQSLAADIPYTVREFVDMGRFSHQSLWSKQDGDRAYHVGEAMKLMGLEALADVPLGQISGGEQQRAGIARCLAQQSPVFLLDEPISNLDVFYQLDIMTQLTKLAGRGHLILIAIHHLEFAMRFCDELLILQKGHVYARGPVSEVFTTQMVHDVFGIDATLFVDPIQQHPRLSMSPADSTCTV